MQQIFKGKIEGTLTQPGWVIIKNLNGRYLATLLNKVCFHNTPCEFPDTPRCVVVTHLFTVLFHSSRKHTIVCKETHKVCKNYSPLCIPLDQFATHHKLMRCKCSLTGEISNENTPLLFEDIFNLCIITNIFTGVNLTHFQVYFNNSTKSPINLSIIAYSCYTCIPFKIILWYQNIIIIVIIGVTDDLNE